MSLGRGTRRISKTKIDQENGHFAAVPHVDFGCGSRHSLVPVVFLKLFVSRPVGIQHCQ